MKILVILRNTEKYFSLASISSLQRSLMCIFYLHLCEVFVFGPTSVYTVEAKSDGHLRECIEHYVLAPCINPCWTHDDLALLGF